MDVEKAFEGALGACKDWKLFIPYFLLYFIPLILLALFVVFSGLGSEIMGFYSDLKEYADNREGEIKIPEYTNFIEAIPLVVMSIIVVTILSIYFKVLFFVMIAKKINKKKYNIFNEVWKYIFRYIWLKILVSLIFLIVPVILFLISLTTIGISWLFILLIFISVCVSLIYFIFIGVRLIFVEPVMFIKNESATETIKIAFKSTKGKFWFAFLIGILIYMINFVSGFFNSFVFTFIFLFPFLAVIYALGSTFSQAFRFYAYLQFRK